MNRSIAQRERIVWTAGHALTRWMIPAGSPRTGFVNQKTDSWKVCVFWNVAVIRCSTGAQLPIPGSFCNIMFVKFSDGTRQKLHVSTEPIVQIAEPVSTE